MRDQPFQLPGVGDREVQPDGGTHAASEHQGGLVRQFGQDPVHVVGVLRHAHSLSGLGECAAGQAPTVVCDHRVAVDEQADQIGTAVGVALTALGDEQ